MLIQEKIGNVGSFAVGGRVVDLLELEWYETGKRIMRKRTRGGKEVALRFLKEAPMLTEGDILYADETTVIVISILPCETMVIRLSSLPAVASVCYEIGNRHLPLFFEEGELLAPFEDPLYRWLTTNGYEASREQRKLLQPLRSTVAGHVHASGGLLSKILRV